MKKLLFSLFLMATAACGFAQNNTASTVATEPDILVIKQASHDFGKIPQSKPVYTNFEIVNTSNEPLTLKSVVASCGCTTPEWSHEAIAPGATSIIKVGYNAAAEGHFDKVITITYADAKTKQLFIKGEVWKAPAGSAPVNPSIQLLKQSNQ